MPSTASAWQTVSQTVTLPAPANGTVLFRAGAYVNGSVTPVVDIEVRSILIEDVTSELAAQLSASAASESASTASTQATIATAQAAAAATARTAAETAQSRASTSADSAAQSKTDAAGSAASAANSATTTANSATAAGQSATAASGSATTAETKATQASQSAQAAAASATTASTKAGEASTSATQAASAKTDAAGSATSAANSATTAANSATTAGQKATAAAGSATQASSSATAAGQSAAAAQSDRTAAETAKAGAETASSNAVVAQQAAEGAASGALATYAMTARVAERGLSVISDQFLGSAAWARWSSQGTLAKGPNSIYPTGSDWDFTVTASQLDGLVMGSPAAAAWPGQTGAEAYVVEVEYSLLSGALTGAAVLLDWNVSGGEFRASKPFSAMTAGVSLAGRTATARAVFRRPSNFSGTLTSHDLFILANYSGAGEALAAKRIKIHRVQVRVASEEEIGRGEVMAEVQATLTQSYLTSAQTNSAIASAESRLNASLGTTNANVTQTSTALADLRGGIATFKFLAQTGGANAAGITAVSMTQSGTGTATSTSALVLHGDNVIAPGTMSVDRLLVGLGKNLITDPTFDNALRHWEIVTVGSAGAQSTGSIRPIGGDWSGVTYPAAQLFQAGTATSGYIDLAAAAFIGSEGQRSLIPVQAGKVYGFSTYLSMHRCTAEMHIIFVDALGGVLATVSKSLPNHGTGGARTPDTWPRVFLAGQAPAGAVAAKAIIRKLGTTAGQSDSYLFVYKPQLEETHAQAIAPSPWSPGGTGMWDGRVLLTDSILARHVKAREITGDHMALNSIIVQGGAQIADAIISRAKIGPQQIMAGFVVNSSGERTTPSDLSAIEVLSGGLVREAGFRTNIMLSCHVRPASGSARIRHHPQNSQSVAKNFLLEGRQFKAS